MEDFMHSIKKGYLFRGIAIFLIVICVAYIYFGYFFSFSDKDNEIRDGLNRLIDKVPEGLNYILPQWSGFIWFFVDLAFLFVMIIFIDKLFVKANDYIKGIKNVDF